MIFVVTGGRHFGCVKGSNGKLVVDLKKRDYIYDVLDAVVGDAPFVTVMHGDCPTGADRVTKSWAEKRGHVEDAHPAKWDSYGNIAGPMRNQQMVDKKPCLCVAFPGGDGTADCVARAMKAGIPVFEARYDKQDVPCCADKPVRSLTSTSRRKRNDRAPSFDF